jgi:hypothetical protein
MDNQVATNRSFFACNKHQPNIFFLFFAKTGTICIWLFFYNPHDNDFFAIHTNFLWQPDIICCKPAQQNNCRLAHTTDYDFFCNAHGNLVATRGHPTLQTSATIFSSGNLPNNEVFFNHTRDLDCNQNPHLQTFTTTKTFQQSTKTLTMKPQIILDLWGLQPEVANQQQLNSRNKHNVFVCDFFRYRDEQLCRIRRDH